MRGEDAFADAVFHNAAVAVFGKSKRESMRRFDVRSARARSQTYGKHKPGMACLSGAFAPD
jgi:hypothetical protein